MISKIKNWYKNKQLVKLVIEEATNLRNHATKEEIKALNFYLLSPNLRDNCIYGQMTGYCNSNRAIELIKISCPRVYKKDETWALALQNNSLNGNPNNETREAYWSPIEIFIYENRQDGNLNNKRLIEYIKGQTDNLNFVNYNKINKLWHTANK